MTSTAVIVLGMHRSGTSALTGVLNRLGVALGPRLIAAQEGVNERGFWEHDEIVEIHNALLHALDSVWHDILPLPERWWRSDPVRPFRDRLEKVLRRDFGGAPLWGLKDPRMCRLLPLWLDLLEGAGVRPVFIHTHRHPFEVARSLERRDGMAHEKALFLWLDHNLSAERWSRGHPRVFVSYDALLDEPRATLERIARCLGLDWPQPIDAKSDEIAAFLSPHLRHHVAEDPGAAAQEGEGRLAAEAFAVFAKAAAMDDAEGLLADFDALQAAFAARVEAFDPVLLGHVADLERGRRALERKIEQMSRSFSWRCTRPLRAVAFVAGLVAGRQRPR